MIDFDKVDKFNGVDGLSITQLSCTERADCLKDFGNVLWQNSPRNFHKRSEFILLNEKFCPISVVIKFSTNLMQFSLSLSWTHLATSRLSVKCLYSSSRNLRNPFPLRFINSRSSAVICPILAPSIDIKLLISSFVIVTRGNNIVMDKGRSDKGSLQL